MDPESLQKKWAQIATREILSRSFEGYQFNPPVVDSVKNTIDLLATLVNNDKDTELRFEDYSETPLLLNQCTMELYCTEFFLNTPEKLNSFALLMELNPKWFIISPANNMRFRIEINFPDLFIKNGV